MLKISILLFLIQIIWAKDHKFTLDEDNICLNEKCGVQINECFEDYECFESIEKCIPQDNPSKNEISEAKSCIKNRSEAAVELLDCAKKMCLRRELKKKQLKAIRKYMNI